MIKVTKQCNSKCTASIRGHTKQSECNRSKSK